MKLFSVGEVIVVVEHRGGIDGGPSLYLLVKTLARPPVQETQRFQEVWRADCFKVDPHEHFFGPEKEVSRDLPENQRQRSIDWALNHLLTEETKQIVASAGYPETAACLQIYFTDEFRWRVREAMFKPE